MKMLFDCKNHQQRLDYKNKFDGNLVFGGKEFHKKTERSAPDMPASGSIHQEQLDVVAETAPREFSRQEQFFESVEACPVCDSENKIFVLNRYGLDFYECVDCTHCFMSPRLKFKKLCELYAKDNTSSRIYKSDAQAKLDFIKALYGLELLKQVGGVSCNRILDFGCGSGTFLKVAFDQGWRYCIGIDPNPNYSECYVDVPGVHFISSTFEDLNPEIISSNYDAITMWNVLEHLYDMQSILIKLKTMLVADGVIFIMVPNFRSLATQIIRDRSATFNWKHVSHFTPESLKLLMERAGFETIFLETVISEIDNIKSALHGQWPYSGFGDPNGVFDAITPEFLHRNLLGSRLLGIFRNAS